MSLSKAKGEEAPPEDPIEGANGSLDWEAVQRGTGTAMAHGWKKFASSMIKALPIGILNFRHQSIALKNIVAHVVASAHTRVENDAIRQSIGHSIERRVGIEIVPDAVYRQDAALLDLLRMLDKLPRRFPFHLSQRPPAMLGKNCMA